MPGRYQFPFEEHYFDFEGLKLHYVDEGAGTPLILVHGQPTWGYVYRKVVPLLVAAGYRCVVPDLMGFGLSDKPGNESAYSLPRHVRSIERLVEELDLSGVVTVGHDWGGPISLGYATHHRANVSAVVILNTFLGVTPVPTIFRLMFTSALSGFLVRRVDLMRKLSFRGKFSGTPLFLRPVPAPAMDQYWMPHPTAASRAGIAAFPKMIPVDESHGNATYVQGIEEVLSTWSVPVLVMFSDGDPFFSVDDGRRIADGVPNGGFELIEGAGHYVTEDAGDEIGKRIISFLREQSL